MRDKVTYYAYHNECLSDTERDTEKKEGDERKAIRQGRKQYVNTTEDVLELGERAFNRAQARSG